jgi:hypothetical protein
MKTFLSDFRTVARLLTFRASSEELQGLNRRHLAIGLLATWLVGIGRWWEDPRADLLQHLGVGSVLYVFVLATFLWLLLWPLRPKHWSLFNVLTFITLTSPPAIVYAIPVRHGMDVHTGQVIRLWLLALVAGWRVLLLFYYLGRGARLSGFRRIVAALFPLAIVVFALTALNLEKVVFDVMGGIHETEGTVNDDAYGVLLLISALSFLLFLPLLVSYLILSVQSFAARRRERTPGNVDLETAPPTEQTTDSDSSSRLREPSIVPK